MMKLIDCCLDLSVEEIIQLPDVQERIKIYQEHSHLAVEQIQRCAKIKDNLVVLDITQEETIYAANRFMIYSPNEISRCIRCGACKKKYRICHWQIYFE
jgi:hypothetical protein